MVAELNQEYSYPVTALCQLLDLPRSSYYYHPAEREDALLRQAIESIAAEFPTYGSRRITQQLRRPPYQLVVNRKQVQRLMGEMGLKRSPKRRKQRTTNSCHGYPRFPNLVMDLSITYPNQVWVSDITYIRLRQDFVYLAVVMDVFTRAIRGWHLHRWLDQTLTLTALRGAFASQAPTIHHSDQGIQYAAHEYIHLLRRHHVQISMADKGEAWQNGYAERLMRTIKEEEVYLSDYDNFADAYAQIGQFIEQVYQHKRIHSALGYLTPAEFEVNWKQQQQHPQSPSDTLSLILG
jgi:transposase InsO family protein